ncbi:MAG TPA: hypothetical protein VGF56_12810 [Rhizomicrobium sp.]|jgi:hypothetical protein
MSLPLAILAGLLLTVATDQPVPGCFFCMRQASLYPVIAAPWHDTVAEYDKPPGHLVTAQDECPTLDEPTRSVCFKGFDRRFTAAFYEDKKVRVEIDSVPLDRSWDVGTGRPATSGAPRHIEFIVQIQEKALKSRPDPEGFRAIGPGGSRKEIEVVNRHAIRLCAQWDCAPKDEKPYPPGFYAYVLRANGDPAHVDKYTLRLSDALKQPIPDLHFRRLVRTWYGPIP